MSEDTDNTSPRGRDLPRPGQREQDDIISDYERRLEALRNGLALQYADLSSQLEKSKEFESLLSGLDSWMDEVGEEMGGLKVRDPKSAALKSQVEKCQVRGHQQYVARMLVRKKGKLYG